MSERVFGLPMIVILSLVATGSIPPAVARGGGGGGFGISRPSAPTLRMPRPAVRSSAVAPRIIARNIEITRHVEITRHIDLARHIDFARHIDVQNDLRLRRRAQLENGLPIAIWPYWSSIDTTPMEVPQANPTVIVMSDLPNGVRERAAPETPLDYSYVAGCHAFPGGYGYHCDTPPNEPVAH